jgi:hypothetical protein
MTDAELRELLGQNQRLLGSLTEKIVEVTALQQKCFTGQAELVQTVESIAIKLGDAQAATDERLDKLLDALAAAEKRQNSFDERLDKLLGAQAASDLRLHRLIQTVERFVRGQSPDGHRKRKG